MQKSVLALAALSLFAGSPVTQAAVTTYNVTQVYNQVVYNNSFPDWDTVFTGSFTYDDATRTVSGLSGMLSQAMDGAPVPGASNWISLDNQLSVVADGTDGLVVTVFKKDSTDVFAGGGFASTGMMGKVYTYGNENAFASIYVPLADPSQALTQSQIDKLAYGDCTPAALMPRTGSGTVCMAGWVSYTSGVAGPGGTMQGTWPITQTITAAVPEPETYAFMLAGLGLVGAVARRRKESND
ncbi:MAG: PEP-CTERM sorting domain-containing protein [Pseudomonadota bacterium]